MYMARLWPNSVRAGSANRSATRHPPELRP